MATYAVDFETFYSADYSVVDLGNWGYTHHPEFDAYLVSIVGDDGNSFVGTPKDFDWESIAGHVWVSHNATFDSAVYERLQELGVASKSALPSEWHDTADLVVYLGCPRSLKNASAVLFGIEMSKDVRDKMKGKPWNSMTPEFQQEVMAYALKDSELCLRIWTEHSAKWPEWERQLSLHTRAMCWRGMPVDAEGVHEDVRLLELQLWKCRSKIPWASDEDAAILSPKAMAAECRKYGVEPPRSMAKDSEEFDAWLEQYGEKLPFANAMSNYRRINTLLLKFRAIERRTKPDGWMPFALKYHGAHCVTGAHEVLTKEGWVPICNWVGGEIAQWSEDGSVQFLEAKAHKYKNTQPMLELTAPYVSGVFTAGHTIPFFKHGKKRFGRCSAEESAKKGSYYAPVSGVLRYAGTLLPDQLKLLAAVQADGHWTKENALQFCLRKQRKIQRAKALLSRLNIPHRVLEFPSTPGQIRIAISRKDCPAWLSPDRKVFGPWLLDSTPEAREAFIDELPHWDGHTHPTNPEYYSSVKSNLEWVATIAHLIGLSVGKLCAKKRGFSLCLRKTHEAMVFRRHWAAGCEAPQVVYCPSTKTGFWVYRYNGVISITGNTGRWSGDSGVNVQNMGRDPVFFDEQGIVGDAEKIEEYKAKIKKGEPVPVPFVDMRKRIKAPKGKKFVVCDLSNIEPRCMAVLGGDTVTLETLRTGADIYEAHARATMRYTDPRPLKEVDGELRRLSKARVLGLGYGCGWLKFVTFAKQMLPAKTYNAVFGAPVSANEIRMFMTSLGKRMRDGKELTEKFQALPPQEKAYWVNSAKQVEAYRKTNTNVTDLWALLEKLMERACGQKELALELPSGRKLCYRAPKNHGGLSAETPRLGRMMRVKYHGGVLVENLTQATARDVFADCVLRLEAAGYSLILHAHDEAVCLVDEATAEADCAAIENIMSTPPEWMPSLPQAAEAHVCSLYTK